MMGTFLEQAIVGRRSRSRDTSPICRSRQFHPGVHRMRRGAAPEIARGDRRGDAVGADAAQASRHKASRARRSRRQRPRDRARCLDGIVGVEFDLQPALAAVEEHAGVAERGLPRSRPARASSGRTARCRRHGSRSAVRRRPDASSWPSWPRTPPASFFMLTSQSDGTTAQTGLPSTSAISVFSTRDGSTPSASAACSPMLAASGS